MYTPIRYLLLDNTSKLAFNAALAPHSISLGQSIFWGCFQLGPVYSINRKSLLFALLNGALGLPRFLLFCIIRLPDHKASPITFWPFFSFDCCFPCCCCLLVLSWEREIKWNYFSRRQIYWLTFECGFSTDSCFETKRRKKIRLWGKLSSPSLSSSSPEESSRRVIGGKRAAHPVITHTRVHIKFPDDGSRKKLWIMRKNIS